MQPKISAIIPVYNTGIYLNKCLDSLFAQTLSPFEVICVDDGSTDSSPDILARYAGEHANLRVIRQENAGQSAAQNRGLDAARGKYVLFVDSDDWLAHADVLQHLWERAEALQADELLFDLSVVAASPEFAASARDLGAYYRPRKGSYPGVCDGQALFPRLLDNHDYFEMTWSRMYLRDFLARERLRFLPGIFHEDSLFTLQATSLAGRVAYLPEQLYVHQLRSNSIMTDDNAVHRCYSTCLALDELAKFAEDRLAGASEDFLRHYRIFTLAWRENNVRLYRSLSRQRRAEVWARFPAERRAALQARMRADTRALRWKDFKRKARRALPPGLRRSKAK